MECGGAANRGRSCRRFRAIGGHSYGFLDAPHRHWGSRSHSFGPGGLAVAAAEASPPVHLRLKLSPQTVERLSEFVAPTGTSLANPVDVGLTGAIEIEIYIQAARSLAADPEIDSVVVIGHGLTPEANRLYAESMIRTGKDFSETFYNGEHSWPRFSTCPGLLRGRNALFETPERAMSVYARIRNYHIWQENIDPVRISSE